MLHGLEKTPEENAKTTNLMREISEIELAIQGGTEKIESLGEEGKVEESMKELEAVEALKAEKTEERELQQLTDTSGTSGHQKLRVCDVCGAYLSVLDSDRRLADHFGGKMHLGYFERPRGTSVVAARAAPGVEVPRVCGQSMTSQPMRTAAGRAWWGSM
ncbi:splicing factor [Ceratobasidium sp. 370]|nr:splicing factor [Ceratobasidium sp. 370]